MSDWEEERAEMQREHNDIVKEIRTEAKTVENYVIVERDGAVFQHYEVLRPNCGIFKLADER